MANDIYVDGSDREWEYYSYFSSVEVGEQNHFFILRKHFLHDPRSPSAFVITKAVGGTSNVMDAQGTVYRKKVV